MANIIGTNISIAITAVNEAIRFNKLDLILSIYYFIKLYLKKYIGEYSIKNTPPRLFAETLIKRFNKQAIY